MKPKTLSATAITAFENCPAYFKAVFLDKVTMSSDDKSAANLGSAIHLAFEEWVRNVYLEKREGPALERLLSIFQFFFDSLFGHGEDERYNEGVKIVTDWFNRTDLSKIEVISVEEKKQFLVHTPLGSVPISYIFDRLDRVPNNVPGQVHYRVVDYKSQRWGYNPDYVRKMIQARIYALAVQLEHKDENPVVEVQMDLLRHQPVSTIFTVEDNRETWRKLQKIVYHVLEHSETEPDRTINPFCRYCPIATTCPELLDNKASGGIQTVGTDIPLAVKMVHHLDNQLKGIESLREQVQKVLLEYAETEELMEWDEDGFAVKVSVSQRRAVDSERLSHIIGPDLMRKYGRVGVTALDTMIKEGELTTEQAVSAKALLNRNFGQPVVKVDRKTPFEGEPE